MYTPKALIETKYAENTQTTQYTALNVTAVVQSFTVTNNSGSAQTFSAHIVPNGGTAGASNVVIDDRSIADGETYVSPEMVNQVLNRGASISTLASNANALVIRCSGVEKSG